ncbi:MAG: ECF transporter S component [Defluviitaleaceae bacterium]|nr:ECF transporter S component [Defluviitaleaceae bacterium]
MTAASRVNIKTIALTGLMIGLTAIMSFTPLGTIPLPIASVTIAFLPAIITVMTIGFLPGLVVALTAGVFSFIRATFVFTWLSPMLLNPLVSIMPRVMIAVVVFLVFTGLNKLLNSLKARKAVAVAVAAAAGSAANTVGVLGMAWLLYGADFYAAAVERGHESAFAFIMVIITTNAGIEILANTIIATAVVLAIHKFLLSKK